MAKKESNEVEYYGSDVEYETEEKEKKFQLTRGKLILFIGIIVIFIVIIIIVIVNSSSEDEGEISKEYNDVDFIRLEEKMIEEAPLYVSQKKIELSDKEYKIMLKDLLVENGGSIDYKEVKAAKICDGYVIASKKDKTLYNAYIDCGKYYKTKGYVEVKKTTTTSKVNKEKDTEKPNILLIGGNEIVMYRGTKYKEPGFTAVDNKDGDITSNVVVSGIVDSSKIGEYKIKYSVKDSSNNYTEVYRIVNIIEQIGSNTTTTAYQRPSYTTTKANTTTARATTARATTKAPNTTKAPATTVRTTTKATTTRNITTKYTAPPTILLNDSVVTVNVGTSYNVYQGYSAYDCNGVDLTSKVKITGSVNTNVAGTYYITFYVTDSYGKSTSKVRTVIVKASKPTSYKITVDRSVISLKKDTSTTIKVNFSPSSASTYGVTFKSANTSIATVDSKGKIIGKKVGTTVITATSGNATATTTVTVTN